MTPPQINPAADCNAICHVVLIHDHDHCQDCCIQMAVAYACLQFRPVTVAGVAYGRLKDLRADPNAKLLMKRVVASLDSSSSTVAQQAGETLGVLLAQLKKLGAAADSAGNESPAPSLPGLQKEVKEVLQSMMNDPSKHGRQVLCIS